MSKLAQVPPLEYNLLNQVKNIYDIVDLSSESAGKDLARLLIKGDLLKEESTFYLLQQKYITSEVFVKSVARMFDPIKPLSKESLMPFLEGAVAGAASMKQLTKCTEELKAVDEEDEEIVGQDSNEKSEITSCDTYMFSGLRTLKPIRYVLTGTLKWSNYLPETYFQWISYLMMSELGLNTVISKQLLSGMKLDISNRAYNYFFNPRGASHIDFENKIIINRPVYPIDAEHTNKQIKRNLMILDREDKVITFDYNMELITEDNILEQAQYYVDEGYRTKKLGEIAIDQDIEKIMDSLKEQKYFVPEIVIPLLPYYCPHPDETADIIYSFK